MNDFAIRAIGIHKRYAGNPALNGFDLAVRAGSVCALLGPNGAGKTTAIKILTTLLQFDAGQASVAGFDLKTQGRQVRRHIGLVGQYAAVDEILTARQNLVMFGELAHLPRRQVQQRADELLTQFDLAETGPKPVSQFSGGMRRRLDLAVSLIVSPRVLFVDEPTTGLDPLGRRQVWASLRSLVATGTTILLTTQYLEEADQLADRVSILKAGQLIAEGTPNELKSAFGGDWLDIILNTEAEMDAVKRILQPIAAGEIHSDINRLSVPVKERTRALVNVVTALAEAKIDPQDISLRRPTLDEVFIHLTGSA